MSAFSNPYLAESVGYGTGRHHGEIHGRNVGYTEGWNDAVREWNEAVREHDETIALWEAALKKRDETIRRLKQRLAEQEALLNDYKKANQTFVDAERDDIAEKEHLFKAFLGVVSIAEPALKAMATLPFEAKSKFFTEYSNLAGELQTDEYIDAHFFPHNQPMIQEYLRVAPPIIEAIRKERVARKAAAAAAAAEPKG